MMLMFLFITNSFIILRRVLRPFVPDYWSSRNNSTAVNLSNGASKINLNLISLPRQFNEYHFPVFPKDVDPWAKWRGLAWSTMMTQLKHNRNWSRNIEWCFISYTLMELSRWMFCLAAFRGKHLDLILSDKTRFDYVWLRLNQIYHVFILRFKWEYQNYREAFTLILAIKTIYSSFISSKQVKWLKWEISSLTNVFPICRFRDCLLASWK